MQILQINPFAQAIGTGTKVALTGIALAGTAGIIAILTAKHFQSRRPNPTTNPPSERPPASQQSTGHRVGIPLPPTTAPTADPITPQNTTTDQTTATEPPATADDILHKLYVQLNHIDKHGFTTSSIEDWTIKKLDIPSKIDKIDSPNVESVYTVIYHVVVNDKNSTPPSGDEIAADKKADFSYRLAQHLLPTLTAS